MRSYLLQFCSILTLPFFFLPTYSIKIWASPGDLPTAIPVNCRNALSQNITCSPDLVSARSIAAGRGLDVATLESYCTTDCYNSLKVNAETFPFCSAWRQLLLMPKVEKRPLKRQSTLAAERLSIKCLSTVPYNNPEYRLQILWHGPTASRASRIGKACRLSHFKPRIHKVTVFSYSTGFCLPALYNGTKAACSDCSYKYGAAMLNSDYGRTKLQPKAFSSLLSSCSVPATKYPYTYTSTNSTASATAYDPISMVPMMESILRSLIEQ